MAVPVVTVVELVVVRDKRRRRAHGDRRGCRGGKDLNINENPVYLICKPIISHLDYPACARPQASANEHRRRFGTPASEHENNRQHKHNVASFTTVIFRSMQ